VALGVNASADDPLDRPLRDAQAEEPRLSAVPVAAWIDRTAKAEPRHEAERAHPGLLAVQIAIEPEQDADQGRRAEPNRDVEDVHSGTI